MTQEFHISVTPVGQNDYLVRTEKVATGVPLAEELVNWPVNDWLAMASHLMNDPLKIVLQGETIASGAIANNSVNLVALGQQLYQALFQGTLRDSWITAQGIAQNQQQVLRLRLGLKDNRLARLPWEVMHAGDRPLATGPYVAFSRFQSGISPASGVPSNNRPQLPEDGVIRVLMVLASPSDQASLNLLKQEAIKLQAELHRQLPRSLNGGYYLPEIELTLLDQPGREELTQALEQGRFHVLHYSGHSNLGPNGGEIYLVSNRTGLTETLSGDDLAGLLVNNNIKMAVFNSCWGTYTATSGIPRDSWERNLTESLVKRGIQSVLAMSERIPDEVALTLTQLFYRNLSQGYPVDLCVSRVRQGLISAYGSPQLYWALPILYLHAEFNGFLYPKTTNDNHTDALAEYSPPVSNNSLPAVGYSAVVDEPDMSVPIEGTIPSELARDNSGLDWLGEDTWGDLVDEIEYDDPTYAEDYAFVSDIFRQLEQPITENEVAEAQPPSPPPKPNQTASETPVNAAPKEPESPNLVPVTKNASSQSVSKVHNFRPASSKKRQRRQKSPILAMVGVGAIAFIVSFALLWQIRQSSIRKTPPIPSPTQTSQTPTDIQQMSTDMVTTVATSKLNQGELEAGLAAVEELLNRNALDNAEIALNLISRQDIQKPAVNFLRGRLAWQSLKRENTKYSIDDVRRYWDNAVRGNPDSSEYQNALGFAYYMEGNLNQANASWLQALSSALATQNSDFQAQLPPEALTSYAGLALGMYKSARSFTGNRRTQYLKEAIKLRQTVLQQDPLNFQAEKLGNNWLWTERTIADWRSLLRQEEITEN
ncbi:heterocyst differentiation protein [Nostoc sp. CENA543]|uniref:cell division protein HetF n=1 Tax=Nostoc sp. CENA543 TaxID=1869241 RepID=UPI000CA37F38|nr:cell division protein HetF [Nostoc sp. CENA543]AUT01329.1 heterocyst differentiation protein [Nostoc sp. CENA543]